MFMRDDWSCQLGRNEERRFDLLYHRTPAMMRCLEIGCLGDDFDRDGESCYKRYTEMRRFGPWAGAHTNHACYRDFCGACASVRRRCVHADVHPRHSSLASSLCGSMTPLVWTTALLADFLGGERAPNHLAWRFMRIAHRPRSPSIWIPLSTSIDCHIL